MHWTSIIADLQAAGLTQTQIAKFVGTTQGAISSLATGKTTQPLFQAGQALLKLHRKHRAKVSA